MGAPFGSLISIDFSFLPLTSPRFVVKSTGLKMAGQIYYLEFEDRRGAAAPVGDLFYHQIQFKIEPERLYFFARRRQ
jgi:hypothetical protein